MNASFEGKVVLVAGGTGGLGRAVSLAFHGEGAQVVVTYRKQRELDDLKQAAGSAGRTIEGHAADVTDEAGVKELIAVLIAQYGQLDALVNTIGGYTGGTKAWESQSDELDRMLSLNLRSGYTLTRSVVPHMIQQGYGSIVNVAAKAAIAPQAGAAAYAASKAAAVALLESMAAELKGTGVRVNSILPNIIDTQANRSALPKADHAKWPKPEDIARVILLLCSDEAKVVHGAAVPVYGGE